MLTYKYAWCFHWFVTDTAGDVGPEVDDLRFAANMARLRDLYGYSQADLVKKLREAGWTTVHQTTISRIEKGERPVRLGEAGAIARVLGSTTQQMLIPGEHAKLISQLSHYRQRIRFDLSHVTDGTYKFLRERAGLELLVAVVNEEVARRGPEWLGGKSAALGIEEELRLATESLERTIEDAVQAGVRQFEEFAKDALPREEALEGMRRFIFGDAPSD